MDAPRSFALDESNPSPIAVEKERWYLTAQFWKRFSVFMSISLSVASLILSAVASLRHESPDMLRVLVVSTVVINSISVSLSALTSLDWKTQAAHDKTFAEQLCKLQHVHKGEQIVVRGQGGWSVLSES